MSSRAKRRTCFPSHIKNIVPYATTPSSPSNVSRITSGAIAPSLPTHQRSPRNSTIVDGKHPDVLPPSRINGILSPNCRKTSSPLSHVGDPERFALVPVNGTPNSAIKSFTTLFFGHRKATRRVFAVTFNGNRFDASTTIVNGPGQQACANR